MFIYWRMEDGRGLRAEWDIINRNLEYNWHGTIKHWLVVTGTMDFLWLSRNSWERLIIPTDELTPSFFRGVGRYTTNQNMKSPFIIPIKSLYNHIFPLFPIVPSWASQKTMGFNEVFHGIFSWEFFMGESQWITHFVLVSQRANPFTGFTVKIGMRNARDEAKKTSKIERYPPVKYYSCGNCWSCWFSSSQSDSLP